MGKHVKEKTINWQFEPAHIHTYFIHFDSDRQIYECRCGRMYDSLGNQWHATTQKVPGE